MDFEERKDYVRDAIAEILDNYGDEFDSEAFVELCEELDNYNGLLGEARCHDMWRIDEFFDKPSQLLDAMDNFELTDDFFYFDGYGDVTTASDKYDVYESVVTVDDILDEIEENYNHITLTKNDSLNKLCKILFEEDFGIDEDFEEENKEDYESDEEFTQRIADIM